MLQATRGAEFPMIAVRTELPETQLREPIIRADLQVQFAGQTVEYRQVPFQSSAEGNNIRIIGTIPTKLSDFKIDPPSLLGIAVKNDAPIQVEMTWKPQ